MTLLERILLIVIGLSVVAVLARWASDNPLHDRTQAQREVHREHVERVNSLTAEVGRLLEEVERLNESPLVIERRARAELRWTRPGEIVLDFGATSDDVAPR